MFDKIPQFSGYKTIHIKEKKRWGGEIPSWKIPGCTQMWSVSMAESILSASNWKWKGWAQQWFVDSTFMWSVGYFLWCLGYIFVKKTVHAVFESYWLGWDIHGVVVILVASIASLLILLRGVALFLNAKQVVSNYQLFLQKMERGRFCTMKVTVYQPQPSLRELSCCSMLFMS